MPPHRRREPGSMKSIGKLKVFWPFLYRYRWWALGGMLALVATAGLNLVLPYLIGRIFDNLIESDISLSPRYFILALGVAAFLALGAFFRVYFVQNLAIRMIADIRREVFAHLMGLSRGFFDEIKSGEIVSRLAGDANIVGMVLTNNVSVSLRQLLTLIGGLTMMIVTSPILTGLVALIVPLIIVPMIFLSRHLVRLSRKAQDEMAEATALATEALQGVVTVQSFVQEPQIRAKYNERVEGQYQVLRKRLVVYAFFAAFMILVMMAAVTSVLWIGAGQVRAGELTGGTLVQFLFYAVMVGGAFQSFSDLWNELLRAVGAGERLAELLSAEDKIVEGEQPLEGKAGAPLLEMRDVSFAYPGFPDKNVLRNVSFAMKRGETLALVGPSGAGKSTIFQLLMRHYDVLAGQILLAGQDIRGLSFADLRGQFAYVAQEPAIFALSIRENIAFARPDASQAEVEEAARAAFADDFVRELPDGYETYVGERGVRLSGGQKARIALARAFLSDAPILLLDEATASLDAESEHFIQLALAELRKTRTVIVIAHRLATVQEADQILVFENGVLVEEGRHMDLVHSSNLYSRLAKMQFLAS